jgi:hypothetical protein
VPASSTSANPASSISAASDADVALDAVGGEVTASLLPALREAGSSWGKLVLTVPR